VPATSPWNLTEAPKKLLPQICTWVPGGPEVGWNWSAFGLGGGKPASTANTMPQPVDPPPEAKPEDALPALNDLAPAEAVGTDVEQFLKGTGFGQSEYGCRRRRSWR
jgi:hypothetical protein